MANDDKKVENKQVLGEITLTVIWIKKSPSKLEQIEKKKKEDERQRIETSKMYFRYVYLISIFSTLIFLSHFFPEGNLDHFYCLVECIKRFFRGY